MATRFTNGVETGWKKCTRPMVGGARSNTLYDACTPSSANLLNCEKVRELLFNDGFKL